MAVSVATRVLSRDLYFGGTLRIVEQVTRLNSPAVRRVRLCWQHTGRLVREGWSGSDGSIVFEHLAAGPWILYVLDHTGEFEAEMIADRMASVDGT